MIVLKTNEKSNTNYNVPFLNIVYLLNVEKIKEDDIVINIKEGKPTIRYFNSSRNKESIYFPDIYVKSQNRIIEVKSEYTFEKQKHNTLEKKEKCKKLGYIRTVYIMNSDGTIFSKI